MLIRIGVVIIGALLAGFFSSLYPEIFPLAIIACFALGLIYGLK
jgi:hypothetical protein